ncbi:MULTISPECIES: flagellar hook-basal body protein [Legionella]|uniref:Flagellar basal body rod protein FlgF n=1 Tax=Legionella maceachernii TaxID=466 RepID=A0A0W0W091_9GAMM|nr:flagellar hook basal-body protein [Legionella maceachernii]KTD25845.1 flagellar basal body rod protein FlgF [Legionella maceachernii]SJZ46789.1 flagellar basal-body rod protein FlgG [Legionella maceachernii]SUP03966.1 Distal rod protein [Legionella maceachernii]
MMMDAIGAAQIALLQDQLRLQSINQNITNMQTPGYKRQLLENKSFSMQLDTEIPSAHQQMQNAKIFTQGTVTQSQNAKDIAISGDGFFEVQTEEGVFYTRRGDLQVNERGELSLATGALLLGKSGPIRVDNNSFTIDSQGIVYVDNHKVEQINLVEFSQMQKLNYRGQGLYESVELPNPANSTIRVLQGFIEQSNVKSVDEMLEMLKTSRHFEASQRVMRTADNLLSTAISQLGEGNV